MASVSRNKAEVLPVLIASVRAARDVAGKRRVDLLMLVIMLSVYYGYGDSVRSVSRLLKLGLETVQKRMAMLKKMGLVDYKDRAKGIVMTEEGKAFVRRFGFLYGEGMRYIDSL